MPRNMSFALTTEQIKNRTKTVTRRFGWDFLKPGDIIQAVEKGMGLKKGEKVKRLCLLKVVSIWKEPLSDMTKEDCIKEGFPGLYPIHFIQMICKYYGSKPSDIINRIEFCYEEGE